MEDTMKRMSHSRNFAFFGIDPSCKCIPAGLFSYPEDLFFFPLGFGLSLSILDPLTGGVRGLRLGDRLDVFSSDRVRVYILSSWVSGLDKSLIVMSFPVFDFGS